MANRLFKRVRDFATFPRSRFHHSRSGDGCP
ncbi:MAG: hypothetical protein MZU79_03030 [Anaerotruncus sp.]|nr:hypothetical protein [Anaerotruncus sp.]